MRENEFTVGISEFIIIVLWRFHICSLLHLVPSKGNKITRCSIIFFFFSHHTVCFGLNQLMTQQHKSRENSHTAHWPRVSWNVFPSAAPRSISFNTQENSNKTKVCTLFPAVVCDKSGFMFAPHNQLLQLVWPALSVQPCAIAATTPAQVN